MDSNLKTRRSLAMTLLLGALALAASSLPPLALVQRADRLLYDLWSRTAPPNAPEEILIVTLDDPTQFRTLARISQEQGARLLISTLEQPGTDNLDAGALGPVVVATASSQLLRETTWTRGGYLWPQRDLDGVIRHERPLITTSSPTPSLAFAGSIALQRPEKTTQQGHDVIPYGELLTVDAKGRRWLRYFDRESFRELTLDQILATPAALENKIVIAGRNAGDRHATPVGLLTTQELLAHELAGYWLGSAVTSGVGHYALIWGLAGLLLLSAAIMPFNLAWSAAVPLLGVGALLAGSAGAFIMEGLWYPAAGPAAFTLLGGLYSACTPRRRPRIEPQPTANPKRRIDLPHRDVTDRLSPAAKTVNVPPSGADTLPSLGRYQLIKTLGRGAMGKVYVGRDPKINRMVAIKTIDLAEEFELEDIDDVRDRFLREAETAGCLSHPNIVTIFDAGEERNIAYIAMELLTGGPLSQYTQADRLLPVATTLDLLSRAATALDYAHRHKVVHRDIKPANIMYDPNTDVLKLTDFGIARLMDVSRTRTGIVLGTPSFMSPEQLEGKNVNGHTDLFALGVSLYQLLTGRLPFRGSSMTELMFVIANEPHQPVKALRKDLPDCVNAVLDKALAKRPANRFTSGAEMAHALREVITQAT